MGKWVKRNWHNTVTSSRPAIHTHNPKRWVYLERKNWNWVTFLISLYHCKEAWLTNRKRSLQDASHCTATNCTSLNTVSVDNRDEYFVTNITVLHHSWKRNFGKLGPYELYSLPSAFPCVCVFFYGSTALVRLGLLHEVPRSHWIRNTIRGKSPLDEGSAHRRLTTHNIHKRETPIPGGIRNRNASKRAANRRLRPRGRWDRLPLCVYYWVFSVRSPQWTLSEVCFLITLQRATFICRCCKFRS